MTTKSRAASPVASRDSLHDRIPIITCHRCSTAGSAERKFCGCCGALLWEPCVGCLTKNPTREAFCSGCGVQLAEAMANFRTRFEADLQHGLRMRGDGRLEEALRCWQAIRVIDHTELKPLNDRVAAAIDALPSDRERMRHEACAALEAARAYAEGFDFDRARRALEDVPCALRDADANGLLQQMQQRIEQIQSLLREIRQDVKANQTIELSFKVERLLALKPDHQVGLNLAAQLAARQRRRDEKKGAALYQQAQQCLQHSQFDRAVEQLQAIAEGVRTPEMGKLYEQVNEIAWLRRDLRTAPIIDDTLMEVAERLVKLLPEDEQIAKLQSKLLARRKGADSDESAADVRWAKPPERPHLGLPVEWLPSFRRLAITSGDAAAPLGDHPGRFMVAAGLALQGLDVTPLKTNLLPAEKQGFLGRLSPKRRKRGAPTAWGVDLSSTALKAIKLSLDKQGEAVVDAVELIEHEKSLSRPDAENERGTLIERSLQEFIARQKPCREKICLGLPGLRVLGRFLKLPPIERAKIPDAMIYETRHQIPIPHDELVWDYHVLSYGESPDDQKKQVKKSKQPAQTQAQTPAHTPVEPRGAPLRAVLVAAKQMQAKEHLFPLQQAGLNVEVLQSDCLALQNLMLYELGDEYAVEGRDDRAWAIADIGSDTTHVLIGSPSLLWFRSFGRGGDDFSRLLMRRFKLTSTQAELLKKQPARARRLSEVDEALAPAFADFATDLQRSLDAFQNEHPQIKLERLFITGGGCQMHGLHRYLQTGQ